MPTKKTLYSFFMSFLVLSLAACSSTKPNVTNHDMAKEESNQVHTAHWSYKGDTGPEHWGDVNPDYAVCTNGKEQSPINIETSQVIEDQQITDVTMNYQPTAFSFSNNGHTIQANPLTSDNSFVIDSQEYKLVQFHFHTPSEHQLNGQNFDMEIHFVHKDAQDKLAVLGVMVKEGAANPYLEKAWDVIPTAETTKDVQLTEPIDIMSLLPKDKNSFRYNGSLTTPPCSEAVKWVVLDNPIEMSKEQIDKFREIFPDNHRPVQPLNERKVKED